MTESSSGVAGLGVSLTPICVEGVTNQQWSESKADVGLGGGTEGKPHSCASPLIQLPVFALVQNVAFHFRDKEETKPFVFFPFLTRKSYF